ncbi:MAG: hypothetical protein Q4D41_11625 [Prevotellaceae bacterium]|nr:hypothetical protein [Prevotellaceae bacterium]
MKKVNNNHILGVLVIALIAICIMSVSSPIRFEKQQSIRERAVKERLIKIRYAEEKYRKANGIYTGDFSVLVNSGLLADSLQYIPYTEKKRFDLVATNQIGKSGRNVPLMECGAKYNDYLSGLDKNSISNLIEEANNAGRYPGLKIGDITTPNDNAGNWE